MTTGDFEPKDMPDESDSFDPDVFADEFDSKTTKIVLGGIATTALLGGIYALARRRLANRKED